MSKNFIIQIEHPVPDYDSWKKEGFDSDPIGREQSGVSGHRICQPVDKPNYVLIELEFNSLNEAEACLVRLRGMWDRVQEKFQWRESPQARIVKVAESKVY